ncbi:MAG: hypothetical protein JWM27_1534, partial [Gemmatimonadetes bacterium]|nr:hypothetical protein [Gemmatimonadota bacterium]
MQAPPPLPTSAEVARALAKVYRRPEFAPERTDGPLRWVAEQWRRVVEWFFALVGRLHLLEHTSPVLFWLLVGWMAVSAVAIAVHLAVTAVQGMRSRERTAAAGEAGPAAAPGRPRTAEGWDE